jgi:hypothetical protein
MFPAALLGFATNYWLERFPNSALACDFWQISWIGTLLD